jgi:hypothetical protein
MGKGKSAVGRQQSWNYDATQKHENASDCKSLRDCRFQGLSIGCASPSANDLPMAIDEKLLKVPLDTPDTHDTRHLILHPLVQWCRTIAIDNGLPQDWEANAIVDSAKVLNGIVALWITVTELITRKPDELYIVTMLGFEFCCVVRLDSC